MASSTLGGILLAAFCLPLAGCGSFAAQGLNAEGVPTVRGGKQWWPATVAAVLRSASYEAELAAAR